MTSSPSYIDETKKQQLILGLPILSSLKQMKHCSMQCSDIQLPQQASKSNNTQMTIGPPKQLSVLSGFNINPFAFQGRDSYIDKQHLTNNSYYQTDMFNCLNSNKHISLLSYDNNTLLPNKEIRNTSDSFYHNFLLPFNHHSNLSIKQEQQPTEFLQHKREGSNERSVMPIVPTPSKTKGMTSLFKPMKEDKEKEKIFVHYKNDKKISKKEILPYMCEHSDCGIAYKTKKQKMSHHNKMNNDCKADTILILKLIAKTKEILIENDNNNKLEGPNVSMKMSKIKKQYENLICNLSLQEYGRYIAGAEF